MCRMKWHTLIPDGSTQEHSKNSAFTVGIWGSCSLIHQWTKVRFFFFFSLNPQIAFEMQVYKKKVNNNLSREKWVTNKKKKCVSPNDKYQYQYWCGHRENIPFLGSAARWASEPRIPTTKQGPWKRKPLQPRRTVSLAQNTQESHRWISIKYKLKRSPQTTGNRSYEKEGRKRKRAGET